MMKKKWHLIFSIIATLIISVSVTACKKDDSDKKLQCVMPEITVLDEGIAWANVANAESYYYNYNGGEWLEAKEIIAFPYISTK